MPTQPKPSGLTEEEWIRQLAELHPDARLPGFWTNVAQNCATWADELTAGPFWRTAAQRLDAWRAEYREKRGADLLIQIGLPPFVSKPEGSIRDKLFRHCKRKDDYIRKAFEPGGPPIPRLGDLVRTRVVCRYIDGVEFLATKLFDLAKEMGCLLDRTREGRITGYFAQHIMVHQEVFYRMASQSRPGKVVCEIQIATQMATQMWEAAHPLYESVRGEEADPEEWQWKPDDPQFIANQLGHMIHLADGFLVQLRQSRKRKA